MFDPRLPGHDIAGGVSSPDAAVEYLRSVVPIVVCGVARSGTQMISDVLNTHAHIVIEPEIHLQSMEAYLDFVERVEEVFDHYSERKGFRLDDRWVRRKSALHHMFWTVSPKGPESCVDKEVTYHGVKTPGLERYGERFEQAFSELQPLYVYALRDVGDVWRSWLTREFLDDVELFRSRYTRSLRQAIRLRNRVGERFAVFDLDTFKAADDQRGYIREQILTKLGIDDQLSWFGGEVPNLNSASQLGYELVTGAEVDAQVASLRSDLDIWGYVARLLDRG